MACKPVAWMSTAPGARVWPLCSGDGCRSQVWHRGAASSCEALQQPPAEGTTSRRRSACLSSSGSVNTPPACALEVNSKQAESLSIGKERPHRTGRSAWERGFTLTRSSSAGQSHPVRPSLSQCLFVFSAVCVYVNPAMFFRCACVSFHLGGQLGPRT